MDSQDLQRLKTRYNIIGADPSLARAIEIATAVAASDLAVLITGESGVGKDVFPRMIHDNSRRKNNKYLAVNCGSIPIGTINAELFGHEKGAFTGAVAERKGYFEEADGGTLFLDEIGELPRETQAMLLRVLQDGEYMKVGSSKVEKTNVRVIAATNVNLENLVARGKFRADLYYRLNGINISLPPLRDRKDDIYLLFRKFSSDFAQQNGLCKPSLDFDGIAKMRSYRWPGNIRQLKNISEAITVLECPPIEAGRERVEISSSTVATYIPQEKDTLIPAIAAPESTTSSFSADDKQMFVKALLDMKQEIDHLKTVVAGLQSGAAVPAPMTLPEPEPDVDEQYSAAPEPAEAQPVSLRASSEERIWQTLERYNGNVKEAARELGISERTIYRKLAQRKAQ